MRALLLAAGLGTRLRPYIDDRPKAMVPIGGRPLLEWTVEWLRDNGVRDLAINLHYLPEAVVDHFGDGTGLGVRIRYSHEPQLLGTAGALLPIADWLCDDTFLVVYGDNLIRLDLDDLLSTHLRHQDFVTVALYGREDVSGSGVAELDGSGRIVRFVEKPRQGEMRSRLVNAGLLVCEPAVLDAIPPGFSDFGRDILPTVLPDERVGGYIMRPTDGLAWIDTPADLVKLEELFRG